MLGPNALIVIREQRLKRFVVVEDMAPKVVPRPNCRIKHQSPASDN
jgi:hypothetical protein